MILRFVAVVVCCLSAWVVQADEGMWMLGNLNKQTRRAMKELGLQMPADKLYSSRRPSLKDAVVSFGGFCSGVVVSEDGLVFTNHHCGFSSVQQHSSVEHDYLKDGFVARNRSEELPNPELYVRFLLRTENVTKRVLGAVKPEMTEPERSGAVDSVMFAISEEVARKDSTLVGIVDAYYGGNEFWLSVYRDYNDVRLVFAPPSSVGKFGWDTDNWVWPRHTGDFCVFRIYAGKNNRPADYSPENVPYRPEYVAPISLDGYKEGSFCMTLGYPGSTERYLSSFGIEEMMNNGNQAQIDVRGIKQAIWKREMDRRDSIRIKYASKYDESSNYWKNSIGVNRAIRKLHVLEKKRAMERELRRWIQQTPGEREKLLRLFPDLELDYKNTREANRALAYFAESFLNGPELIQLALSILNFDFEGERKTVEANLKAIVEKYANLDLEIDKEVFTAMVNIYDDPAINLGIDLIGKMFEINMQTRESAMNIARNERLLNAAVRRMYSSRNFYPDANSTMRLSFGTVCGYTPFDGAEYDYYTTTKGILEKVKTHAGDVDFEVQPELLSLFSNRDFGRYAGEKGEMNVCFISNNDITGGNSGSAMFNARGELLGLAFDGNWEAMSSDILYEPKMQRCIGVDVRYILFMIEKYGKAGDLIRELKIVSGK